MINKAKYNCLEELKKSGAPIVIVAVTQEIEAIINSCTENGIKFIGASPKMIKNMGDKAAAKETMKKAGVPTIPGSKGIIKSKPRTGTIVEKYENLNFFDSDILAWSKGSKYADNLRKYFIQT